MPGYAAQEKAASLALLFGFPAAGDASAAHRQIDSISQTQNLLSHAFNVFLIAVTFFIISLGPTRDRYNDISAHDIFRSVLVLGKGIEDSD